MRNFHTRHREHPVHGVDPERIQPDPPGPPVTISLIVPPILMILLFGFVLNPTVANLRLGVVDDSRTPESRELIATLTESESFAPAGNYLSAGQLGDVIARGKLDAGVIVPYDFGRDLQRGRPATVQFLLNAMDANTARIAQAYAESVIATYNNGLRQSGLNADFRRVAAAGASRAVKWCYIPHTSTIRDWSARGLW
jgi:ABC-2 type transport system permease protein